MARTKVQSELIATNAISGTIIADGAITSTHLAANCVDSSELVTGSIDTIHIAANQVTATKIVTNGVLTRHISDDQITTDKLANSINTDIATGPAALPKAGGTMTGNLVINTAGNGLPSISLSHSNSSADNFILTGGVPGTSNAGFSIRDVDASANRLVINSSGNVGIGTDSPDRNLHIETAGDSYLRVSGNRGNANDLHVGNIEFENTFSSAGVIAEMRAITGNSGTQSTKGQLAFYTDDGSTYAERMRIDSSGNVGIGVTNIGSAGLSLSNSMNFNMSEGVNSSFVNIFRQASSAATVIANGYKYTNTANKVASSYASSWAKSAIALNYGNTIFYNDTAATTAVGTDVTPTERMRIDSSGNVLVGNTVANPASGFASQKGFGYAASTGKVEIATDANAAVMELGKNNSNDGNLLVFRKQSNVVGSIGVNSNDMYIASIGTYSSGLMFEGSSGARDIRPCDSSGNLLDGEVDLGDTTARFQHLYFSGGLYGGSDVRTNAVGIGTTPAGSSVGRTTSAPDGIFWHNGGGMEDYSMHRTAGAWSGPNYQQLKIDWDTGIIIDGGTAYGKSGVHIHGNISMGDSTYSNFTSPNYPVHICADNYGLMVESSTGYGHLGSNNTSYFHFGGNRNFYFANRCEASGGFHTYSDENLKKEITVIPSALNKVAQMNGVTFKWKDAVKRGGGDAGKQFGVTAQNMLEIDSELPTLNKDPLYNVEDSVNADDEFYSMDYSRITPFLIEAVKELKTKLEAAEARIETLEE